MTLYAYLKTNYTFFMFGEHLCCALTRGLSGLSLQLLELINWKWTNWFSIISTKLHSYFQKTSCKLHNKVSQVASVPGLWTNICAGGDFYIAETKCFQCRGWMHLKIQSVRGLHVSATILHSYWGSTGSNLEVGTVFDFKSQFKPTEVSSFVTSIWPRSLGLLCLDNCI